MREYFYYAVVYTGERQDGEIGRVARSDRVHMSNNLKSYFDRENIETVMPCRTLKEADEISEFWNECYKRNDTYLFQK